MKFNNFEDLEDSDSELPARLNPNGIACYIELLFSTQKLDYRIPVSLYLERLARLLSADATIMFSVTSLEHRYKEWLNAVKGIPGYRIYETKRNGYHPPRPYTCYLCLCPVTPRLEEM